MEYAVLIVIALAMLISGLLAMVRGFLREILSVASWLVAGVTAYYFHPFVPSMADLSSWSDKLAFVVSVGIVFLLTLVAASIVTIKISDLVLDSRVGAVDRTFGFALGVVRGYLIVALAFAILDTIISPARQADVLRNVPILEPVRGTLTQTISELACLCKNPNADAPTSRQADTRPEMQPGSPRPQGRDKVQFPTTVSLISWAGLLSVLLGTLLVIGIRFLSVALVGLLLRNQQDPLFSWNQIQFTKAHFTNAAAAIVAAPLLIAFGLTKEATLLSIPLGLGLSLALMWALPTDH